MSSGSINDNDILGGHGLDMEPFLSASMPSPTDNDVIPGASMDGSAYYGQPPDIGSLRTENRMLKTKIRTLHNDLQAEQDSVSGLRRKLTGIERDRLDAVAKSNEDVSRLDSELTRLRAQLEKGEAVRQNLEFELAKARRDIGHEKRNFMERENSSTELLDAMKQKVTELTGQVELLLGDMESSKMNYHAQEESYRAAIAERDSALTSIQGQRDALQADRDSAQATVRHKESTIRELEEHVGEVEDEVRQQTDALRRQVGETELIREREDRLKQELDTAVTRVKSLEESIEAERAAHLESKFNSEIIQLRIRDLESAIEMEKSAKSEAMTGTEKLTKQLRDLQKIYDDERRNGLQQEDRIKQAEQEYATLTKQLQSDLADKREIIKRLSSELDNHASEFADLKQELNKAKKRQVYLEETYSGCMKELELLLDNFRLDTPTKTKSSKVPSYMTSGTAKKKSITKPEGKKPLSPAVIMESIRHTMIAYKRKTDDLSAELAKVSAQHEVSSKECTQNRSQMTTKEKALEKSEKALSKASQEVSALKESNRELQAMVRELQAQIDSLRNSVDREQQQIVRQSEQMVKVVNKSRNEEQTNAEFLHSLYQQLVSAQPLEAQAMEAQTPRGTTRDVGAMVTEQLGRLVGNLHRTMERLRHLEKSAGDKDEMVASMQRAHDEQLEKLASIAEGRTQQWQQQKVEMEAHYSKLMAEVHNRQKKTQALADQGWEKLRVTGSIQNGLEKECQQLRGSMLQIQREHDTLLTTCALLCGALYPLCSNHAALARERDMLTEHTARLEAFKAEVQQLVDALTPDAAAAAPSSPSTFSRRPVLTFRAAAIAVMAANRLTQLPRPRHCRMFLVRDVLPGVSNMAVCAGGMTAAADDNNKQEFTGAANPWLFEKEGLTKGGEDYAIHWLTSGDLKSTIMATLGELQVVLQRAREGEGVDSSIIIREARGGFQKLVRHLPGLFPTIPGCGGEPQAGGMRGERGSVVRRLGHGLNRCLTTGGDEKCRDQRYDSTQTTLGQLQSHVLEFTRRLHGAEVERRDLRAELTRLTDQQQEWAETSNIRDDYQRMQEQLENVIPRDKFEHVCAELNSALKREQQAQKLLNQQSQQIHKLSSNLDVHMSAGNEKEQTLGEAVQGLTEAKMELKRQEQRLRQLQRQLQQAEAEKQILTENIGDAESALRTTSQDRETLAEYVRNIEHGLTQVQATLSKGLISPADFTQLLNPDNLPRNINKSCGPELATCQRLVAGFVDSQRQMATRLDAMLTEIHAHKEHIGTLKRELNAACKREYDVEMERLTGAYEPSLSAPGSHRDSPGPRAAVIGEDANMVHQQPQQQKDGFSPLVEDMNSSSFSAPPLATPTKSMQTKRELRYPSTGPHGPKMGTSVPKRKPAKAKS